MSYEFFAMISRMKYIDRWALMRNTEQESLSQHSYEVAVLSHALALISNRQCGTNLNAEKAAVWGLFHDASEILTGDMPTPVKYYSEQIRGAYKQVEADAQDRLVEMLPAYLQEDYADALKMTGSDPEEDTALRKIVKAADKLSALIKCIEEEKAGNKEFTEARASTERLIHELDCEPAELFMKDFLESYSLTLDQLKN